MDVTGIRRLFVGAFVLIALEPSAARAQGTTGAPDPATITPAMIALGDSIFHGKLGGALCQICHGPAGKGVNPLGPSLIDKEWLHGDGSYGFLIQTINDGVPKPKKSAAPMPAKGGGQLTTAQIQAVAAYVFSLNQKQGGEQSPRDESPG
jgi:mono/diheme cytochrome c family protein